MPVNHAGSRCVDDMYRDSDDHSSRRQRGGGDEHGDSQRHTAEWTGRDFGVVIDVDAGCSDENDDADEERCVDDRYGSDWWLVG